MELWKHQKQAIEIAKNHPSYALFMEQGCGKTPTMINIFRNKWLEANHSIATLILCPAIVVDNWADEIERFAPKMAKYVQTLKGKRIERIACLKKAFADGKRIFITNYEAVDMDDLLVSKVTSHFYLKDIFHNGILICDESHRLKGYNAKRSKIMQAVSKHFANRYLLSGTPILNDVGDIWAQFKILDQGARFGTSYFAFRNNYFFNSNATKPWVEFPNWQPKQGASEKVRELMSQISMRVEKKDCLDLPPLIQQQIKLEMTAEQNKHYTNLEDDLITYINNKEVVTSIALTKLIKCQQVLSGFLNTDDGIQYLKESPKADALIEVIEDASAAKIIVWANFKGDYRIIASALDKAKIDHVFLTGEQNQKEKENALVTFKKGSARVLVASPAAAGTGVNLIESSLSIWYDRSFNLEHRLQALARNHRGGSEIHEKITSIDLVFPKTLDSKILKALDNKEDIANVCLDYNFYERN